MVVNSVSGQRNNKVLDIGDGMISLRNWEWLFYNECWLWLTVGEDGWDNSECRKKAMGVILAETRWTKAVHSRGRKEGRNYLDNKRKMTAWWIIVEEGCEDKKARFLTGVTGCLKMPFTVLQWMQNKIGSKSWRNLIWGMLNVMHLWNTHEHIWLRNAYLSLLLKIDMKAGVKD